MTFARTCLLRGAMASALVLGCASLAAPTARADEPAPPQAPPPQAPPPQALPPTWTAEQLRELVGPIALYPDVILASLLPATNFPLDVVSAARWVEAQGGQPTEAPQEEPWDASVKAMVQFPDVLQWMSANLEWLEQMGTAVCYQQADVLQAIQEFRRAARAAGNLATDAHQTIVEQRPEEAPPTAPTVLVIEPSRPEIVYVPSYDPYQVVRPWSAGASWPLLDFGFGFHVGSYGPWCWHDLRWGWWSGSAYLGWGLYMSDAYYYWGRPRPSGWYAGPYRPQPWRAPYRTTSWRYPPRTIRPPTRHSGHSGGVYAPRTASSVVRPPTDPRPTTRPFVRTYRAPGGATIVPTGVPSLRSAPTQRTLPLPTPSVRTGPWPGTTPTVRTLPRTTPAPRTLPPTPTLQTPYTRTPNPVTYPPIVGPSARGWSVRGNGSLTPSIRTTPLPTSQPRVLLTPQPRFLPTAPLPGPIRSGSPFPNGSTRGMSDRGRSSLGPPTPPPPPPPPLRAPGKGHR